MAKTILIVDDSTTVRQQLRIFLSDNGFTVVEGVDGVDGLEKARAHTVDMMIVDINMPRMGGIELVQEVRKLAQYGQTPIFFLTTENSQELRAHGKSVGATAWIIKPFNPDVLLKGVNKVLGL